VASGELLVKKYGKIIDSKMMEKWLVASNWWFFTFGQD
jgi:hypothetical protein